MNRHWIALPLAAALSLTFLAGCGKKDDSETRPRKAPVRETAFTIPYDTSRLVIDTLRADLNGDGEKEYIVTSREKRIPPLNGNMQAFDKVEVFRYDSARGKTVSLFVDAFDNGVNLYFLDATGNGNPEVIVVLDAGGNDRMTSAGMNVYGVNESGELSILFYAEEGAPEFRDLDGDKIMEIIQTGQYMGIMSHADAIEYTAAIHAYNGEFFVEANDMYPQYFDNVLRDKARAYTKLKSAKKASADREIELYTAVADLLLWTSSKGNRDQLHRFWLVEHAFLKEKLSPSYYEDLETLFMESYEQPSEPVPTKPVYQS